METKILIKNEIFTIDCDTYKGDGDWETRGVAYKFAIESIIRYFVCFNELPYNLSFTDKENEILLKVVEIEIDFLANNIYMTLKDIS